MKPSLGFTLAEVMVAIAILAMMGLLTFGSLSRTIEGRDRGQEVADHYQEVRLAMLRMAREISMAFVSINQFCEDPANATLFRASRGARGSRLDFTSFAHVKTRIDANESDQNELSYFVDNDPDRRGQYALFRRESPRIDEEPDEGGRQEVMTRSVERLEFEFYDATRDDWRDDWDTERTDDRHTLPEFVKIKLTVIDPRGNEETFATQTRIYLSGKARTWQTGQIPCQ